MHSGLNMIHSSEFDNVPIPNRYFCLARAYIDASRVLCASLIAEEFAFQYSSARVIMHLYRHSIELFLKGAILHKSGKNSLSHHLLPDLVADYKALFPGSEYAFDIPFGTENPSEDGAEAIWHVPIEQFDQYHKTLDQRYRYPTDKKGNLFDELEGFVPDMFMNESAQIQAEFLKLEKKIAGAIY